VLIAFSEAMSDFGALRPMITPVPIIAACLESTRSQASFFLRVN
jgi:hypothetical protein